MKIGTTFAHLLECKLVQTLWKAVWWFLTSLIIKPYYPAILLMSIYMKKIQSIILKDIYTSTFTGLLFNKSNILFKISNMCSSVDEWKKEDVVYVYGEGNSNSLQYSWLENSMDREAWWTIVHGVHKVRHDWAINMQYICIMKYYSPIKKFKPCHLQQMDRPWGCYAKWTKSDRKRLRPYDFTYILTL